VPQTTSSRQKCAAEAEMNRAACAEKNDNTRHYTLIENKIISQSSRTFILARGERRFLFAAVADNHFYGRMKWLFIARARLLIRLTLHSILHL